MITQLLKAAIKREVQNSLSFRLPKVSVKVNQGTVTGVIEPLLDGRTFQRFSGIPFAKPPVGELRFRAPQKLMKFDRNEIDCSREANQCLQKSLFYRIYVGSEDCLNLNVYVPNDVNKNEKLPVMIFVHGGAFSFGSNNRDQCSPEFLLMENVIVVTLNYRLHVLGFSCIPEMGIYGNAGLKDQQLGLEWVHENIEYFGGNRDNVTLFGESAGAVSAHLHSLNKKSRKYFNKMILQSGNAFCDWVIQPNPKEKTKRIVEIMKGRTSSPKDIYESLMRIDAKDLFNNRIKCQEDYEKKRNIPVIMKPIIEVESDEAFLTKLPVDIIREDGLDIKIPSITGFNNGDGMIQMVHYLNKLSETDKKLEIFLPSTLSIEPQSNEAKLFAEEMKSIYFGNQGLTEKTLIQFRKLCNDLHYTIPTIMFNEFKKKYSPESKQYTYEFGIESRLNYVKPATKAKHIPGVFHADELSYLFDYKILGYQFAKSSKEWKYREMMCKMWTNFAKYTDPTPDHDNELKVKWNPVDQNLNYLKITNDGNTLDQDISKEIIDFWRKSYSKYNGSFLNPRYHFEKY